MTEDLYKKSGVDVEKGEQLVEWLKAEDKAISNPFAKLVGGLGGFAGLVAPDFSSFERPLLVAGTDGVGTKLLLALEEGDLSGVGIDLVAMCVNDLYCIGASPMFFIDYYATGVLSQEQFKSVLASIKVGLSQCNTPLLGGETAELPGLYKEGHFDLAGFVVGVVDQARTLGPDKVKDGDALVALPSSGFHSNGYSLIRSWIAESPQPEFLSRLLSPTRIYHEIPQLLEKMGPSLHALANITGGGISGNLCRIIPEGLSAHVYPSQIRTPEWMLSFMNAYESDFLTLEKVLNMGVGMIAALDPDEVESFLSNCKTSGLDAYTIGEIRTGKTPVVFEGNG